MRLQREDSHGHAHPFDHTAPAAATELAIALGLLLTAWLAGTARAGGDCTITVEPDTVPVGGQFVVSGNFGAGAEVHVVRGESVNPPEDSEPVYTSPQNRSSFEATITMGPGSEGVWTVWGLIFATECGDSAQVTVTAVPDTAMDASGWPMATAVGRSPARARHRVATRRREHPGRGQRHSAPTAGARPRSKASNAGDAGPMATE